ncbi:MyTH4 domain-containing protein [Pelagophyceae sp. CCMP2097]|nr:MyTH4 domain-containing protein [Pelagophyceae sp. CCMP2097]
MADAGGWTAVQDELGRTYYYNTATLETKWERPQELAADSAADWDERADPASGNVYYFHKKTQQTSWTAPPGYKGADEATWLGKLDEASGREYYYNSATKETTWTRPASMAAPAAKSPPPAKPAPPAAKPAPPAKPPPPASPKPAAPASPKPPPPASPKPPPPASPRPPPPAARPPPASAPPPAAVAATASALPATAWAAIEEASLVDLCKQYSSMDFDSYAEKQFQLNRKGMFKSKTQVDKVTRWKNEVIKQPLLIHKDGASSSEAVQLFRNVTGFMGDRGSSKAGIDHCQKILSNMLLAAEPLRNECYCQIVKQTNGNPSDESTVRGWQLFTACLATFPPSEDLAPHLGWYYAQAASSENAVVARYAEFCLRKLPVIMALGPRREPPTVVEVESAVRLDKALVRVYFLDEKFVTLPVDAWTTASALVRGVAEVLKMSPQGARPFQLFEVSSEAEERVLEAEERVLDLAAYWHRITSEARSKGGGKGASVEEFRFVYKVRHFFDVPDGDGSAIELLYVQAKHDVVDARYPCSTQDAVTLAALQIQEEYGDVPEGECAYLRGSLGKYLAPKVLAEDEDAKFEERLLKLYRKLAGYSQAEARLSYLDYIKSWKIYGSSYFVAEPRQNRDFPSEVILAISAKGILVVDPLTREVIQEYPYSQVVTWGHSANSFVIVTGNAVKQVKAFFKTEQGTCRFATTAEVLTEGRSTPQSWPSSVLVERAPFESPCRHGDEHHGPCVRRGAHALT